MKIGVVGLSHLGIVASACLAAAGHDVLAVDGDRALVEALAAGRAPVFEPGLDALLAPGATRPRFVTDPRGLADCAAVVIAVDTPTDDDNHSDLSVLEAHVNRAGPWLPKDGVVALMSQVPVGYTRELAARLRTARPDSRARLYYWVETLVIGDAVARYRTPERIILGVPDGGGAEAVLETLVGGFGCPVFRMNYESAELTKAAINFYLATSVTYANALADLCEQVGASMQAMAPALRSDRRIGAHAYIRPSLGIAGGNLERDLVHLARLADEHGVDGRVFRFVLDASARRYEWLQRAVDTHVLAGGAPRVAVWGIAYKKNTRSTKNAVSLRLLAALAGRADVAVYDPEAELPAAVPGVTVTSHALDAVKGADGLVIVTDWDEFARADVAAVRDALRRPVVIDAVGVLDPAAVRAAGIRYVGIGETA